MINQNIIPLDSLFDMIYDYGPRLRYQMSRETYPVYKLEKEEDDIDNENQRMQLFSTHFSSAVPDKKIIGKLVKYIGTDKVIEVNSYLGLWSYLLATHDINIKSTSKRKPHLIPFIDIENLNPIDAIQKYNDRNILLTVSPKNNNDLYDTIKEFQGNRIILISEKKLADKIINNITPTQTLLEELKQKPIQYEWVLNNEYKIPQWLNHEYKVYLIEKLGV